MRYLVCSHSLHPDSNETTATTATTDNEDGYEMNDWSKDNSQAKSGKPDEEAGEKERFVKTLLRRMLKWAGHEFNRTQKNCWQR